MARQVEDIVVRLVGEGFEALDKIKGSFRELGKVTNLAEKDILAARDSLLDYARKAGNTEAVNKGLGDAFKGLRSQVDLCSNAYRVLSADLRQIDEVSRGATQSVMAQREAVLSSTAAGTQNVAALQQQRAALIALRAQTRDSSTAFNQFSADIQAVETRLTNLATVSSRLNTVLSRARSGTSAGARAELVALDDGIAALRQEIDAIDLLNKRTRALAVTQQQRLEIEQRLNTSLAARRQIQFQESARTARETVRTGATTFNSRDLTQGPLSAQNISQRLGDLPNTTAGLSQELGELNERLVNTYRNTAAYLQVAMQMAGVQRELTSVTQGYAQALLMGIRTGTVSPSVRNLQEAATALRAEMAQLDTTTTEGSRAYADNAREASALERRLRTLADAYRQVSSMATTAATAEQNAANAGIRGNYLNRGAVRQQEQALRELGGRVQQGVAGTPLLLPAAGQTSAAGTGAAMSGGARRLTGQVETTFGAGVDARGYSPRSTFQQQFLPTAAVGTAPGVGFAAGAAQAFDNLGRSTDRARRPLRDIFAELERVRGASNGSVNSLQAQISAWAQIRSAVSSSAPVFATATKQIEALGRQQARLQVGRRGPSTGQLVQAGGAAISGGIFGGPEGFLGGVGGAVLGTALPGIGTAGGAFAGAAAGAQVGMFRQQLAGTADYAASIGKLQIALRGVVGSQAAYDAAIRSAAAATRDLNIPQEEATRGLTRLSAAVIGAGGTVADSSFAFRAMSEAIKATGGNAEQVDGALLALTQVFSKGKVSAEELNQIAERLPGTFTLFAQAAGKTGPELQKALEQGQVGLNDLMKFLDLTSKRYGTTALTIAGSSQDAGARLTVAFQAMRLEVGKALQPLGAELQGAFAAFIKDITPAVVGSAKAIAAALSFFTTNEVAGGLARFALQAGAVALAIKGLQAASARLVALNIASWFTGAASGATQLQLPIAGATTKVGIFKAAVTGLGTALKALLPLTLITITVDVIVKGIAKLIAAREELKKLRNERNSVPEEGEGIGPKLVLNAQRRYTGASREKIIRDQQEQQKFVAGLRKQLQDLEATQSGLGTAYGQTAIGGIANIGRGFEQENTKAAIELLKEKITASEEVLNLNVRTFKTEAEIEKARQAALSKKFADPTGDEDASTKAADKARKDAEAAAAEQQRLNEANAQAQLRLSDSVFKAQVDFDRKRFELQQELINRERDLRIAALTGVAAETASQTAQFFRTIDELRQRATQAAVDVTGSQQALQNAVFMRSVTAAPTAAGGGIANILPGTRGGPNINEGVGYGRGRLHAGQDLGLDIGDPIHARRAGTVMQAYPSGFGKVGGAVVVRYDDGTQGTYGHTTPSVRTGSPVAAGQRIATVAPDGSNTHLHYELRDALGKLINPINALTASLKVPAGARQATGVAAQQRRNAADQGDVAVAQVDFDTAVKYKDLLEEMVQKRLPQEVQLFAIEGAKAYNAQSQALRDNVAELQKQQELQMSGVRQEVIDGEMQKFQLSRNYSREIAQLNAELTQKEVLEDPTGTKANGINARIAATTQGYADQKAALDELTAAQIAFNDAQRYGQDNRIGLGIKEGAKAYVESVGTMREATAQLTQTGIKGVEEALFSLVTTGTANFREFAAEILKQSARMILQLTIQRIVMQIIGAISRNPVSPSAPGGDWMSAVDRMNPTSEYAMGGAFAKNNIVPYAMGGVVGKPTLFKFAQGGAMRTGLMGEAGPEAIMPLKRGADGRLGVSSSGGGSAPVNVTVNVDASGNSQVAGDQNQGAQLGRVIAGAVQQELIKQRRPGGLLA